MKVRTILIICLVGLILCAVANLFAADIVPYGTDIRVRTDREILIGSARPGDRFPVFVDEDVFVRGRMVIPRGERAEIRLSRVREDRDEVSFTLDTININRRTYDVRSDIAREAPSRESGSGNGSGLGTGTKTLLGAAGGAIVGGSIAGTKGALIGAAAGAGGGLLWAGGTQHDARIPARSSLLFRLRDDLVLRDR
jgi:hypothetical protein